MTDQPTCPACGDPQHDGLLCAKCTTQLRRDLEQLPALWAELPTTYLRQSATGDEHGSRSHDAPLQYDVGAATVRDSVANTISTWIRELSFGDDTNLAPNIGAWCRWLTDRTERIRGHMSAAQIVDELHYAANIIRQAVDPHSDAIYCGNCPICDKRVYAPPDADTALCRWCWIAGDQSTLPVPARQAGAWKAAEDRLVTRSQVFEALTFNGVPVPNTTFRSWIHRGQLQARRYQRNGTPLYRFGDALLLARAAALMPDQSKDTLTDRQG